MSILLIEYAIYGRITQDNKQNESYDKNVTMDVKTKLTSLMKDSGIIKITNQTMGNDPCIGTHKKLIIKINGVIHTYDEGGTVNMNELFTEAVFNNF
ncbi:MAG: hypothetical protein HRU38_19525 [Saccharospirillaceae bacterium]|nr:hypothetical protein [Pseudomonadales bacterium]NRB80828.1 hypothetical protein [Saccharospirillaceae bacterium]